MTNSESIEVVEEPISIDDYLRLVEDVGWTRFVNPEAAKIALENSIWSAVAVDRSKGQVVGAVRVIGDGGIFFYIQDLMVCSAYQGQGIGTTLMGHATKYLKRKTPTKSRVSLFTNPDKTGFYERFGFMGPSSGVAGMTKSTRTVPPR